MSNKTPPPMKRISPANASDYAARCTMEAEKSRLEGHHKKHADFSAMAEHFRQFTKKL